jgi:GAF domain-containing protein
MIGDMQSDSLQQILMAASRERSESTVFRIVDGLAAQPHTALVRIWLKRLGTSVRIANMRRECPDQSRCLHLVASSGRSLAEPGVDWTRTEGDFRRFPLGVRKVGQIVSTATGLLVTDTAQRSEWIARPEWASREQIRSFAGEPLVFGQETLGVLAVFSRIELSEIDKPFHDSRANPLPILGFEAERRKAWLHPSPSRASLSLDRRSGFRYAWRWVA